MSLYTLLQDQTRPAVSVVPSGATGQGGLFTLDQEVLKWGRAESLIILHSSD